MRPNSVINGSAPPGAWKPGRCNPLSWADADETLLPPSPRSAKSAPSRAWLCRPLSKALSIPWPEPPKACSYPAFRVKTALLITKASITSALKLLVHIFNCPVPFYIFKYYHKLLGAAARLGREEIALTPGSHPSGGGEGTSEL